MGQPPAGLSQVPPGYTYTVPVVEMHSFHDEAARLEGEIADLRAQRPSLALPIVMLAVGGGVAIVSGLVWVTASAVESVSYSSSSDDASTTFGIVALGGAAVAVIGIVLLINAIGDRSELGAEIRPREQRLRQLRSGQVMLGSFGDRNTAGLSLTLTL